MKGGGKIVLKRIGIGCLFFFHIVCCLQGQTVAPEKTTEGRYVINLENVRLEVDPEIGARVVSLQYNGQEFLTGKDVNAINWGSSVWPSPQEDWTWPPPAAWDRARYQVVLLKDTLRMVSQPDLKTGLVLTKSYYGDAIDQSLVMEYTIDNRGSTSRQVAPWEVTRVPPDGISFFPLGKGNSWGGLKPLTNEIDGISWFCYNAAKLPKKGDRQLYADGAEGWLAHIKGRLLLAKKFADVPVGESAPNEGEVEWYVSPVETGKSYQEIEHQGPYRHLEVGEKFVWKVMWYLKEIPDSIPVREGEPRLVRYVRALIKGKD